MAKKTSVINPENNITFINALSHEGRGIAQVAGKTLFIDGALLNEKVSFEYQKKHKRFDEGKVIEVIEASPDRATPICRHYNECGGCSLQHVKSDAQIRLKQQVVLEQLKHFGQVSPQKILPPILGQTEGYRRKARLGVKFVLKKGKVLVGFREKSSGLLADLEVCEVLHPSIGKIFPELKALIQSLEAYQQIPQLEVAVGDVASALVFRHLMPLSQKDKQILIEFGQKHQLWIFLQAGGPESVIPIWPVNEDTLYYQLPNYQVQIGFKPTDFTQVNAGVNRQMVSRVIELLELSSDDRVLDLFCGLGNFTLPMARIAAKVVGVEVSQSAINGARQNALKNNIQNVEFYVEDLQKEMLSTKKSQTDKLDIEQFQDSWARQSYTKVFLDPPRTGALEVLPLIHRLKVSQIVYVSCNPATLARDLNHLVHQFGFELLALGVLDMFPHTSHIESIAVLKNTKGIKEIKGRDNG